MSTLGGIVYVKGVGVLDEDGHGDPDAPRQVFYESTRSTPAETMVVMGIESDKTFVAAKPPGNIRSECEFGQLVTWPDGIVRPRFVRMEYSK